MKLIKCTLVTLVFLFELPSISSDCGCTEQLGVEDGTIPSDKLTASSAYEDYPAEHGRLNTASGWIPEYLNQFQWIQADLDDAKPVIGLVTQGLNDGPLWVTLYKVNWRNNDTTFHTVLNENGTEIFKGNTDQNTEVTQMFQSTIYAQFIRIYPMEWHINIALRFELLGPCSDSGEKLGVEDGRIPADNITASSVFQSDNFGPDRGRLNTISDNNGYGAWVPSTSENSWIQADLGTMKSVIGVVTQGRSDFAIWVTSYNVLYSNDGTNFEMVKNKNGSTVFIGNTDQNTEVTNFFESAINAQLVRISPISWQRRVALRFELLGPCPDMEAPTVICLDDISQATVHGKSTSSVTWNNATVTDNVDSSLSVTCSPASGTAFSVGSTTVYCSATDTTGNIGRCTFNVIVKDEEIPNVICPFDISKFTVEGTSTSSATWGELRVMDNFDPSLSANCSPASGTLFGVGLTTVNCTAEDTAGNTGSCTFSVEVIDEEIPNVICPSDISKFTVEGKLTSSATWCELTVIDNVDASLSATCSHVSGTLFSVGSTTVNCTAEDTAGNTGSCIFNVEVFADSKTITGGFTIVKIDRNLVSFTADYDDPTSDAYQELALLIIKALTAIFRSAPGFLDIQILDFKSGSIIVQYDIMLESTGATASDLDLLFSENVNDAGKLSGSTLYLDEGSTQIFQEICPDDYCKNGGTCFMDIDDFESSCMCTESYKGETCNEKLILIEHILLAVLGSCLLLLIISLCLICCYYMPRGRQPN